MKLLILLLTLFLLSGCLTQQDTNKLKVAIIDKTAEQIKGYDNEVITEKPIVAEKPVNAIIDEFDLSEVTKWKSTDEVKDWPITTNLSVNISGNKMFLSYDKSNTWPEAKAVGLMLNANVWAVFKDGDKVIACTWEWIPKRATIVKEYERIPNTFKEHFGIEYDPKIHATYIFVAGLSRNNVRNVKERSQVVRIS